MADTTFTSGTVIASSWLNTINDKAYSIVDAVIDFGCDNTGATNCTTQMLAFFNHCITNGVRGYIPAGSYLITPGVLVFNTPFVDANWPEIETAGYELVTFLRADSTNSPMITWTNGTATSPAGRYWLGGSLGGITFSQNGIATAANQHSLSMRGVWGMKIGWMRSNDIGGSCVYLPEVLYTGNNPDPYAVTFCEFEAVECNRGDRYAFENQNWVGLNGCTIKRLRAIECVLGMFYGMGAGNRVVAASGGSNGGWMFDDGTTSANTGGSPSRFYLDFAELDDPENGFRINKLTLSKFIGIRFVHRYNFGPLNPSGGYWPRIAVDLAGGASPSTAQIEMEIVHRVEAGGTKPDMGVFVDGNSAGGNLISTKIEQRVIDNAAFGFVDADLYDNVSTNSQIHLTRDYKVINDLIIKPAVLVRCAAGTAVGTAGYGSLTSKLVFATELSDRGGYYDNVNGWYTVPFSGLYRFSGRITLTPNAASTTLFLGVGAAVAGVFSSTLLDKRFAFGAGVGSTTFDIDAVLNLTVDQQVFLMAVQSGGSSNLTSPISDSANNTWSIEAL